MARERADLVIVGAGTLGGGASACARARGRRDVGVRGRSRGGAGVPADGWVDPPRNVRADSLAMQRAGVSLREGVGFVGIRTRAGRRGRRELTAVQTSAGTIETPRVLLTGGPALQAVAAAAGARAWVGYVRHQVAVTEGSGALHADTTAMAFD